MTTKTASPRPSKKPAYSRQTRDVAVMGGNLAGLLWRKFRAECPAHLVELVDLCKTLKDLELWVCPEMQDPPHPVDHQTLIKTVLKAERILVGEDGARGNP